MTILDTFLQQILSALSSRNGTALIDLLALDLNSLPTDLQKPYNNLHSFLNQQYPASKDAELSSKIKASLPSTSFATFQIPFSELLNQYFRYLRDFASTSNLQKAKLIRQLTSQCILALGNPDYGSMMIPIALSFTRVLGSIAANLDRNPALAVSDPSLRDTSGAGSEGGGKVSHLEQAANTLREAFVKCLTGAPGTSRLQRPAVTDKRSGIYLTANSTLKLLHQAGKLRNAVQMFSSIDVQSPPLDYYPAAQRVTYLYYLGRFHFANNHFFHAQKCLQSAYDQCHRDALPQRRKILIYLFASSICLGRLPNKILLRDRAAHTISKPFLRLCQIIKAGDLGALDVFLDYTSPSGTNIEARWFMRMKILLQLRNRCEVLCWRSLIFHTFNAVGFIPDESSTDGGNGSNTKVPGVPWIRFGSIHEAAVFSWLRAHAHPHNRKQSYVDPEFEGMPSDPDSDSDSSYPSPDDDDENTPTLNEVTSILTALISQSLLGGFVQHDALDASKSRWAIREQRVAGTARRSWREVGFPRVWDVVREKAQNWEAAEYVPGWVTLGRLIEDGVGSV